MTPRHTFRVSLTEVAHFRRLVMFLEAAELLAEEQDDDALRQLVEDTRDDLVALSE